MASFNTTDSIGSIVQKIYIDIEKLDKNTKGNTKKITYVRNIITDLVEKTDSNKTQLDVMTKKFDAIHQKFVELDIQNNKQKQTNDRLMMVMVIVVLFVIYREGMSSSYYSAWNEL